MVRSSLQNEISYYPEKVVDSLNQKSPTSRIGVILPTYCEADNIINIIHSIESLEPTATILVIDDSSPDNTELIINNMQKTFSNIMLLKRSSKQGLGTAIRDGFAFLCSLPNPPDYIITMDADHSHNPQDISRLLEVATKGYDLVIGSRYCSQGQVKGWPLSRSMISKTANSLTRFIINLPLKDFTSGFRCYSRKYIINALPHLHSQTYEIQIETIRQAKLQRSKVVEIPIIFENRKKGKSKLTLTEITAFLEYIIKVLTRTFS